MNTCFRIGKNHGNELPSNVVFFDVITSGGVNLNGRETKYTPYKFEMAKAVAFRRRGNEWYAKTEKIFSSSADFWAWIRNRSRPKEPTGLFTYNWHFVGQAIGLWNELDNERFSLSIPKRDGIYENGDSYSISAWNGFVAIDDRPFVLYLVGRTGTVRCIDVKNYYDIPMQQLSDTFGYEMPTCVCQSADRAVRIDNLNNRVNAIARCMLTLMSDWKKLNRGNFQPTATRLAWSNYRHTFIKNHDIIIDNKKIDREFERRGYFGGEINHWFRGKYDGPVYKVDCVGLYASEMLSGMFPVRIVDSRQFADSVSPPSTDESLCTMAEVVVSGNRDLPMRKMDGGVDYPCGEFHTVLCGSELQSAWRCGRIRTWLRWYQYESAPIFAEYIDYWWTVRKAAKAASDRATDIMAKLMMNSLYGRFAQRKPAWSVEQGIAAPIRWGNFVAVSNKTKKFEKFRAMCGTVQRKNGSVEKSDTWPAISAIVTSNGRATMRSIRRSLPNKSCLAQSTDSLFLTEQGYGRFSAERWINPNTLGRFRLEAVLHGIDIHSANSYSYNGGEVRSGATETRSKEAENRWTTYRTLKSGEIVALGLCTDVPIKKGAFVIVPKHDSRTFDSDGWTTDS